MRLRGEFKDDLGIPSSSSTFIQSLKLKAWSLLYLIHILKHLMQRLWTGISLIRGEKVPDIIYLLRAYKLLQNKAMALAFKPKMMCAHFNRAVM